MNYKEEFTVVTRRPPPYVVFREPEKMITDAEWDAEIKQTRKRRRIKTWKLLARCILYCVAGIAFFVAILFISKGLLIIPCTIGVFWSVFVPGYYFVLELEYIQ